MSQSQTSNLLAIAQGELGVQEIGGNNRGPRVEEYLAACGLGPGYAWCAAFVTWCFLKAGYTLPKPRALAGAANWFPAGRLVSRQDVRPGDLFGIYDSTLKRTVHVGFVVRIEVFEDNPAELVTIEGNSNDEGSREGKEVCIRRRPLSQPKKFARWT